MKKRYKIPLFFLLAVVIIAAIGVAYFFQRSGALTGLSTEPAGGGGVVPDVNPLSTDVNPFQDYKNPFEEE